MSENFPLVALGNLLVKSEERAEIDLDARYQHVTVKLWGKGVGLREEVDGASIVASKMFVVRTNQFILSKIDVTTQDPVQWGEASLEKRQPEQPAWSVPACAWLTSNCE